MQISGYAPLTDELYYERSISIFPVDTYFSINDVLNISALRNYVTLYAAEGFTGTAINITCDQSNMGAFNNRASSAQVRG